VDGDQHCFTLANLYYTADPLSSKDDGENTDSEMMYEWVNSLPLDKGASIDAQCVAAAAAAAAGRSAEGRSCPDVLLHRSEAQDLHRGLVNNINNNCTVVREMLCSRDEKEFKNRCCFRTTSSNRAERTR
jgi:hypothetical protein